MQDFELCPHTADLKLRVYGDSLATLFCNAVVGMFQSIKPAARGCLYKEGRLVCPTLPERHDVCIDSSDTEALLVDFLSHALYLSDVHNEAYLDAHIHFLSQTKIKATLLGVKIQGFEIEIKAVTYHELAITQDIHGIWQTSIVFDI